MKRLALIAPILVALSASAHAAVVVVDSVGGSTTGGTYLAPDFLATTVITFDDVSVVNTTTPTPSPFSSGGFAFTGGGAAVNGSVSGSYAAPAGDTTNYLTTGFDGVGGTKTETLVLGQTYTHFGLYWGSIDSYNTLLFYQGAALVGTFTGSDVPSPANGNQTDDPTNRYVNFSGAFDSVVFQTGSPAFEVDNIALGGPSRVGGVPEPSTWAMMILGFFGVGFMAYRRSGRRNGMAFRAV